VAVFCASNLLFPGDFSPQLHERVVESIHHSFLEQNDGVVGNAHVFRAYLGAAAGNAAHADAVSFFDLGDAVGGIQGVHFQSGQANHNTRTDKLFFCRWALNMADALTQ
jgi:hypothetical protein